MVTHERLVNRTRGTVLATRIEHAMNPWRRARGLLGRTELPVGHALVLRPCRSIHACGMRFPIDALYLSADGTVLRVLTPLEPWHLGPLVWRARWIVEVPAGTVAITGTQRGDVVALEAEEVRPAGQDDQAAGHETGPVGEGRTAPPACRQEHDERRESAQTGAIEQGR